MKILLALSLLFSSVAASATRLNIPYLSSAVPFNTPADLTNLQLLLSSDCNNASTSCITKTAITNHVSSWVDVSANAYNFTGNGAPIWTNGTLNGQPCMVIAAGSSFSNSVALLAAAGQSFSVFAVYNPTNFAIVPTLAYFKLSDGNSLQFFAYNGAGYQFLDLGTATNYAGARASAAFGTANQYYAVTMTYDVNTTTYQYYASGVATTTTTMPAGPAAIASTFIGNSSAGGANPANICEIELTTDVASAGEIAGMQTYFHNKYGL